MSVARRVLPAVLVVTALAMIVWAGTLGSDSADAPVTDAAVERLIPADGSPVAVRQAEIGIDLAPGWTGVLIVDGVEIPQDQLRIVDAENQIFFQPGAGKEIEALRPGPHAVEAQFWRTASETRTEARSVTWQFRVA